MGFQPWWPLTGQQKLRGVCQKRPVWQSFFPCWLMVWNLFFHVLGIIIPIWLSYVSEGLKPPIRWWSVTCDMTWWHDIFGAPFPAKKWICCWNLRVNCRRYLWCSYSFCFRSIFWDTPNVPFLPMYLQIFNICDIENFLLGSPYFVAAKIDPLGPHCGLGKAVPPTPTGSQSPRVDL